MSLDDYNRKRKFDQTPEPPGEVVSGQGPLRFVVQMHEASRLHYDFRIEAGGVFRSWAVPKGPSVNVQDQRLAVFVEDHPLAYGSFEGVIPKGNYGAGTVMVWDEGTFVERGSTGREDSEKAVLRGLEQGHITLLLDGKKLRGEFALIRFKDTDQKSWLLVKKRDDHSSYADITREDRSVKTGRSMKEIAAEAPALGDVWLPARGGPGRKKKSVPPVSQPASGEIARERLPRRVKPMLATAWPESDEPFAQEGWISEPDFSGHRALAEIEKGTVRLHSKALLSFNSKFPQVVQALQKHRDLTALIDGDIAEVDGHQVYWVRDLLHLDGDNLRDLPLVERKKRLDALPIFDETVRLVASFESGEDQDLLVRDGASAYKSGTSRSWLRIKAASSQKEQGPTLTHLDKVYWPAEKVTKGDLIEYYRQVAPFLLPHLKDRPESLHRHPDGIEAQGFFQKDLTGHRPRWVQIERIYSESVARSIDYLVCQNDATLLYMANMGCIELNPWLSRVGSLDRPDFVVIDLDPDKSRAPDYSEVTTVALELHKILDAIGALHLCKTSGSTGLHFCIPTQGRYTYDESRAFAEAVCQEVHRRLPDLTSMERTPAKRRGKLYLDCYQNAQGQTLASVYSVRPRPGAPVSTPLKWEELTPELDPREFTIHNVPARLQELGDLWKPMLEKTVDLESCALKIAPVGN